MKTQISSVLIAMLLTACGSTQKEEPVKSGKQGEGTASGIETKTASFGEESEGTEQEETNDDDEQTDTKDEKKSGKGGKRPPPPPPAKPEDLTFDDAALNEQFAKVKAQGEAIEARRKELCPKETSDEACRQKNFPTLDKLAKKLGESCIAVKPQRPPMPPQGPGAGQEPPREPKLTDAQKAEIKESASKKLLTPACTDAISEVETALKK